MDLNPRTNSYAYINDEAIICNHRNIDESRYQFNKLINSISKQLQSSKYSSKKVIQYTVQYCAKRKPTKSKQEMNPSGITVLKVTSYSQLSIRCNPSSNKERSRSRYVSGIDLRIHLAGRNLIYRVRNDT